MYQNGHFNDLYLIEKFRQAGGVEIGSRIGSRQSRFNVAPYSSNYNFDPYSSLFKFKKTIDSEPPYQPSSKKRDAWLANFWRTEPTLSGVVSQVVMLDANRGWQLIGGRNQVTRFSKLLHNVEGGKGWRHFMKKLALSFWTSDIGGLVEIERLGDEEGPLVSLYNVDPTRSQLTGSYEFPLEFTSTIDSDTQLWPIGSFFRVCSSPDNRERFYDLGYCAVSRCLDLAKIMYSVWQHDLEKLGSRAPRGLLLLQNITDEQWNEAMQVRDARMTHKELDYYGAIEVLASGGIDQIDAKLVALSQLPDQFDQFSMFESLMVGYSLCFGYDIREFIPVTSGRLGSATETEQQHEKATQKGSRDLILGIQESLQKLLPRSLHFEFQERDIGGEIEKLVMQQSQADLVATMSQMRENIGAVLSNEEIRQLLARQGLIPEDWTLQEEDILVTDEDTLNERYLDDPKVRAACERYSDEPIVMYKYDPVLGEQMKTLWSSGDIALRRRSYPIDGFMITIEDIEHQVNVTRAMMN